MEAVVTQRTTETPASPAVSAAPALQGWPQRVLLAVDDTAESHKAVALAAKVAGQSNAEVIAVHVHPIEPRKWGPYEVETRFEAFSLVHDAVAELRTAGVKSRGIVINAPIDRVGDAIGTQADRLDADLVVMGARNLSGISQLFGGSVSRDAARKAHCPVTLAS
jgi:nucleotide-binding universal stress UspA family protein